MNKKLITILLLPLWALASDITIDTVKESPFGKTLEVNAKIEQLSNQKQAIVSRLGGHLERYYVQPGQTVKRGDRIALIQSLELSKMSATYLALKKEALAAHTQLESTQKLYDKGLASRQALNDAQIKTAQIESRLGSLEAQLRSLGIDAAKLKKETDELTIRAHAPGRIDALLVDLHTNVSPSTPLVSLVQSSGYYAVAYLPVAQALKLKKGIRAEITVGEERFMCRFLQVMPRVDDETQRARALFWIESGTAPLLLDYYTTMRIALPPRQVRMAVKRGALTLFEGEWVVFVPVVTAEEHAKEEHEAHEKDEAHAEGEEHEHEEHAPVPFAPVVVKPGSTFGGFVAVEGLHIGDEYVSDGTWFVKSLLLKSELGEHGH